MQRKIKTSMMKTLKSSFFSAGETAKSKLFRLLKNLGNAVDDLDGDDIENKCRLLIMNRSLF